MNTEQANKVKQALDAVNFAGSNLASQVNISVNKDNQVVLECNTETGWISGQLITRAIHTARQAVPGEELGYIVGSSQSKGGHATILIF